MEVGEADESRSVDIMRTEYQPASSQQPANEYWEPTKTRWPADVHVEPAGRRQPSKEAESDSDEEPAEAAEPEPATDKRRYPLRQRRALPVSG